MSRNPFSLREKPVLSSVEGARDEGEFNLVFSLFLFPLTHPFGEVFFYAYLIQPITYS
jgi:hypothetical protein